MRIELHCHSTHSDGSLPATEVAERAFARDVVLFCLTDHDTCAGYPATTTLFPNALRGVELSCSEDERTVHLLVYERVKTGAWSIMEDALQLQRKVRRERVHTISERLAALGVHFDPEALLTRVSGTVGRPHIADELVRVGAVASRSEAFDRYLKDGGPGDVRIERLSLGDGLELGKAAGGCMSLAHPHTSGDRTDSMVRRFKPAGLTGLEVYYGLYNSKKRKKWAALAELHGMVATAGSDFHGAGLPKVLAPGVDVPEEIGVRVLRWLERDAAAR